MSWTPKDEEIDFDEGTLILVGQAFVETITEQCAAKVDANGESVENDWKQSGKMLSDVSYGQDGSIDFNAPYAEYVNEVKPFLGVSPQFQPKLEEKLQPVLERALILKKKA